MKFQNRKEQRKVCETLAGLLCPLKEYLDDETKECVEIGLRIILNTGIEGENDN